MEMTLVAHEQVAETLVDSGMGSAQRVWLGEHLDIFLTESQTQILLKLLPTTCRGF